MKKETYDITGMTCSACSTRVEKGVAKLAGVQDVAVNLLTNSMSVTYDDKALDTGKIIQKVADVGYGAALHQKAAGQAKASAQPGDAAAKVL